VYLKGHKDQMNLEIQRTEEEFNRVLVTLNSKSERVLVSLIKQRENLVEEHLAATTHNASCYEDITEWYEEVEDLARSTSKQPYKQYMEDVKQQAEKHKAIFAALLDAHVEALDHLKGRKKSWDEWVIGLSNFLDEEPDWTKESLDSITKDLNALTITEGSSKKQETLKNTEDKEEIDIEGIDVDDLPVYGICRWAVSLLLLDLLIRVRFWSRTRLLSQKRPPKARRRRTSSRPVRRWIQTVDKPIVSCE
jgi:hypothetical protein